MRQSTLAAAVAAIAAATVAPLAWWLFAALDPYHQGLVAGVLAAVLSILLIPAGLARTAAAGAPPVRPQQPQHPRLLHPSRARLAQRARLAERSQAPQLPSPPRTLAAALAAIPNAIVLPPVDGSGDGSGEGVIVASSDPAFIAAVTAAVCSVRGRRIYLVAGIAPRPDHDRAGRFAWLYHSTIMDGRLAGSEPVKRVDTLYLRSVATDYWRIRPAGQLDHWPDALARR